MDKYILTPQFSDFEYPKAFPYAQYAGQSQITSFFNACNDFKRRMIESFVEELRKTINLKVTSKGSAYYMEHYFGLSPIPAPSSSSVQANVQYDRGDVKYDMPERFKYDDLLSADEQQSAYLPSSAWAKIAIAIIDYSAPCYNLPLVFKILESYASAMDTSLGWEDAKIEVSPAPHNITTITLPNTEIWRAFANIATYAPNIIGLPFGKCVKFAIDGLEEGGGTEDTPQSQPEEAGNA